MAQGEPVRNWLKRVEAEQEMFTRLIQDALKDGNHRVVTPKTQDPKKTREAIEYAAKTINANIETRLNKGRVFIIPK